MLLFYLLYCLPRVNGSKEYDGNFLFDELPGVRVVVPPASDERIAELRDAENEKVIESLARFLRRRAADRDLEPAEDWAPISPGFRSEAIDALDSGRIYQPETDVVLLRELPDWFRLHGLAAYEVEEEGRGGAACGTALSGYPFELACRCGCLECVKHALRWNSHIFWPRQLEFRSARKHQDGRFDIDEYMPNERYLILPDKPDKPERIPLPTQTSAAAATTPDSTMTVTLPDNASTTEKPIPTDPKWSPTEGRDGFTFKTLAKKHNMGETTVRDRIRDRGEEVVKRRVLRPPGSGRRRANMAWFPHDPFDAR